MSIISRNEDFIIENKCITSVSYGPKLIPRKKNIFNLFYDVRIVIQLFINLNKVSPFQHYRHLGHDNVLLCVSVWEGICSS